MWTKKNNLICESLCSFFDRGLSWEKQSVAAAAAVGNQMWTTEPLETVRIWTDRNQTNDI